LVVDIFNVVKPPLNVVMFSIRQRLWLEKAIMPVVTQECQPTLCIRVAKKSFIYIYL